MEHSSRGGTRHPKTRGQAIEEFGAEIVVEAFDDTTAEEPSAVVFGILLEALAEFHLVIDGEDQNRFPSVRSAEPNPNPTSISLDLHLRDPAFSGVQMIEIAEDPQCLTNASGHILHIAVDDDTLMRVRRSHILAQVGDIDFWHEEAITGTQSPAGGSSTAHCGLRARFGIGGRLARRTRSEVSIARLTAGNMMLHQTSGNGDLYLGKDGGDITIFDLDTEELVVFQQSEILAHSDTLRAEPRTEVGKQLAAVIDTAHAWVLSGSGELATATSGEVIILDITDDRPVRIDAEGLLARTSGVHITAAAQYKRKLIERTVTSTARSLPYDLCIDRTRVWVTASGHGQVIIRSSD